jgi:hypothetical protein
VTARAPVARPAGRGPSTRAVLAGLAVVVVVPYLVALVVLWSRPWWHLGGDEALVGLRSWDVGGETPWLGPYSRYGWNHPGPLLFWILAAPVHLFGEVARGATTGALVVNAVAAVAVVVLVARRAGPVAAAGSVALVATLVAGTQYVLWSVWNPHVTLLAFLAFLVAAWCIAEGDLVGWPVAAVTAVFCVQSHVGYATVVSVVGLVAVVLAVVPWWRSGRSRAAPAPRTVLVVGGSFLGAVVLMVPVLVDQAVGTGNLVDLVAWFGEGGRDTLGLDAAVGQLSRQLLPWGPWAGGAEHIVPPFGSTVPLSGWWLLVPAVAIGGTALVAARRRDLAVLRLLALVTSAAVVGLFAIAAVTPPPFPYLFVWIHVVAAAVWGTVVLGLARAAAAWTSSRWGSGAVAGTAATTGEHAAVGSASDGRVGVGALVAVGLLALVPVLALVVVIPRTELPESATGRAVGELLPAALEAVPEGASFSLAADDLYTRVVEGLGTALVAEGREIVVAPEASLAWGTFREGDPDSDPDVVLRLAVGDEALAVGPPPGWVEIARSDPLDPAEQAERAALGRRLAAEAARQGRAGLLELYRFGPWELVTPDATGLEAEALERYVALARQGQPFALYLRLEDGG